jgi:hypothetical protein
LHGLSCQRGCGHCPHLRLLYWSGHARRLEAPKVAAVTFEAEGVRNQCDYANMPAAADPGHMRHDLRALVASKAERRQR